MQMPAMLFEVKRNTTFERKCEPSACTPIFAFFSSVGFYVLTEILNNGYSYFKFLHKKKASFRRLCHMRKVNYYFYLDLIN